MLPDETTRRERARVAVLPIPYDLTTSYQPGARRGPLAILEASTHLETYDDELDRETCERGADRHPARRGARHQRSRGDAWRGSSGSPAPVVDGGRFLVGLGGEHSVTAPLVRAVRSRHPRLGVLQLDAHADLRDTFEGSPLNHACVMHRVIDDGVPLAQVGIRSLTAEERALVRERRDLHGVRAGGRQRSRSSAGSAASSTRCPRRSTSPSTSTPSIPSIMPATGTPGAGRARLVPRPSPCCARSPPRQADRRLRRRRAGADARATSRRTSSPPSWSTSCSATRSCSAQGRNGSERHRSGSDRTN